MDDTNVFLPLKTKGIRKMTRIAITSIAGFIISSILIFIQLITHEQNLRTQFPYMPTDYSYIIVTVVIVIIFLIIIIVPFSLIIHGLKNLRYILGDDVLIIQFGLIKKIIPYEYIMDVYNAPSGYFQPYLPRWRAKSGASGLALGKFKCIVDESLCEVSLWGTSKEELIILSVFPPKKKMKFYGISPEMKWNFIKEIMNHGVKVKDLDFEE